MGSRPVRNHELQISARQLQDALNAIGRIEDNIRRATAAVRAAKRPQNASRKAVKVLNALNAIRANVRRAKATAAATAAALPRSTQLTTLNRTLEQQTVNAIERIRANMHRAAATASTMMPRGASKRPRNASPRNARMEPRAKKARVF